MGYFIAPKQIFEQIFSRDYFFFPYLFSFFSLSFSFLAITLSLFLSLSVFFSVSLFLSLFFAFFPTMYDEYIGCPNLSDQENRFSIVPPQETGGQNRIYPRATIVLRRAELKNSELRLHG